MEQLRQQVADAQAEATEQRELVHRQAPQLMEVWAMAASFAASAWSACIVGGAGGAPTLP